MHNVLEFVWGLEVNAHQTTQPYFREDIDDINDRNNFKYYTIIVTIIILLLIMRVRHMGS